MWRLLDQSFSDMSKHVTPLSSSILLKGDSDSAGLRWAPDSTPLPASWVVLTLPGQHPLSITNRVQYPERFVMTAEARMVKS